MSKKYSRNITVFFDTPQHLNTFINMLAWMELCGNIGHRTKFIVDLDGDGTARPKFSFDTDDMQKQYKKLRQEICDEYCKNRTPAELSVLADAIFEFE